MEEKKQKYTYVISILIMMFILGIFFSKTLTIESNTEGYLSVVATLESVTVIESDKEENLEIYQLTYSYEVDGEQYFIVSDINESAKPTTGSEIEILYSSTDPSDSVVKKIDSKISFFFLVILFIILPTIMVLHEKEDIINEKLFKSRLKKGILLKNTFAFMLGTVNITMINTLANSINPVQVFNYVYQSFSVIIFINILLILVSIAIIIHTIFSNKEKEI
ncbi:MAG: hypothetical protein R3Y13_00455 [bacterium]